MEPVRNDDLLNQDPRDRSQHDFPLEKPNYKFKNLLEMKTKFRKPSNLSTIRISGAMICLLFSVVMHAQELRLGAGAQVLGTINGAFGGPSLGLEGSINNHFGLVLDLELGYGAIGRSRTIRPGINYYFKENRKGFFVGVHMKYIRLKERPDRDFYDDKLFATGFSVGVKANLGKQTDLLVNLSPHVTHGGREESDVAGMSVQVGISHKLGK